MPLSFVSRHSCIWYVGHGHGEANKWSTDRPSKCRATGGNYPADNRPIVGQSLVSILGSGDIPFLGSRKKIETGDSRVSLTSLVLNVTFNFFWLHFFSVAVKMSLLKGILLDTVDWLFVWHFHLSSVSVCCVLWPCVYYFISIKKLNSLKHLVRTTVAGTQN